LAPTEAKVVARAQEEVADLADGRFVGDGRAGHRCCAEHVELRLEHRRWRHRGWNVQRPMVLLVFGYRLERGARAAAVQQRVRTVRGQTVWRLVPSLRHFLDAELQTGQPDCLVAAALQRSRDHGALQLFPQRIFVFRISEQNSFFYFGLIKLNFQLGTYKIGISKI